METIKGMGRPINIVKEEPFEKIAKQNNLQDTNEE